MQLLIFDHDEVPLGPLTDLRAVFDVRTGILTTRQRWEHILEQQALTRRKGHRIELEDEREYLCINGRWLAPEDRLRFRAGHALIDKETNTVLALAARGSDVRHYLENGELSDPMETRAVTDAIVLHHAWDVIRYRDQLIAIDVPLSQLVDARIPRDDADVVGDEPIEIHATARLFPGVVLDVTKGPIRVGPRAMIRPNAVLCGPCAIGDDSVVLDQAIIRSNTVIGPVCKVAGEVGGTIFQGYSNKAHDGHLGDSWIGEWVNLGAGTTNSNLLNTYSEVMMRIESSQSREPTGLTFLGAIIGDHVKTAIGTQIMTGSVFGTGAMIAKTAAPQTCVDRFAWLTDMGARRYRLEKFLEVARAVMARRDVIPDAEYVAALAALYESSRPTEQASG